MSLNLQLVPLTLPFGTEFPGTPQEQLAQIAAYMVIGGQDTFNGINYGSVTPTPDNRDKPWFKTDGSGNPIGWFSWNGSAWVQIPTVIQSGGTSSRPSGVPYGQLYIDTDIGGRLLIYNGANWITSDGGSGEIRFVRGTDSAAILTDNPGWTLVTDIAAQVPGVAGDGSGSGFSNRAAETTVGEETHTQTEAELATHSHNVPNGQGSARANGNAGPGGILASGPGNNGPTDPDGASTPFNVMQPTRFLFCIQKS